MHRIRAHIQVYSAIHGGCSSKYRTVSILNVQQIVGVGILIRKKRAVADELSSSVASRSQLRLSRECRRLNAHQPEPPVASDSGFTIQYDTIEEFNVDSKAEYSA